MQIDAITKKNIFYNIRVSSKANKIFNTILKSENVKDL